jgi:hypothetical protein
MACEEYCRQETAHRRFSVAADRTQQTERKRERNKKQEISDMNKI